METIVHVENGEYLGQTRFAPNLLRETLILSILDVAGVAGLGKKNGVIDRVKGIKIGRCKDSNHLSVDVYLRVLTGYTVADVAYRVQEAVINAAAQLIPEKIDRVNVIVKGAKYGSNTKQK